jgi:hypothetical protein
MNYDDHKHQLNQLEDIWMTRRVKFLSNELI